MLRIVGSNNKFCLFCAQLRHTCRVLPVEFVFCSSFVWVMKITRVLRKRFVKWFERIVWNDLWPSSIVYYCQISSVPTLLSSVSTNSKDLSTRTSLLTILIWLLCTRRAMQVLWPETPELFSSKRSLHNLFWPSDLD